MQVQATPRSAAIAGAWAAFGFVPLDAWLDHHSSISILSHNLLWLAAAAVFLFIPAYFLVIGRETEPFSRTWFANPEERARYGVVVRRMLVWLSSGAVVGAVWSVVFAFVVGKGMAS
jgi:hypothetical protein